LQQCSPFVSRDDAEKFLESYSKTKQHLQPMVMPFMVA
jgi:hypothetical protein